MTEALRLSPGSLFAGDYRVVRPLQSGGMGALYVVEQLSTGKERALKLMLPGLVEEPGPRRRFELEAKIGARVKSDHVVETIAAGVDPATQIPFIAMELLDGEDLARLLVRRRRLPAAEVREIFDQLCHALGEAHREGIVHRDVKPENVFLAKARRRGEPFMVKVLDFGIARVLAEAATSSSHTQSSLGTPMWMAPEQAEAGRTIAAATDVWPLGLIAFRLLTGYLFWKAPYDPSATMLMLLAEALMHPIPSASARAAEYRCAGRIPPGFDAWFARCVARPLADRYADAGEAFAALDAVLAAVPPEGAESSSELGEAAVAIADASTGPGRRTWAGVGPGALDGRLALEAVSKALAPAAAFKVPSPPVARPRPGAPSPIPRPGAAGRLGSPSFRAMPSMPKLRPVPPSLAAEASETQTHVRPLAPMARAPAAEPVEPALVEPDGPTIVLEPPTRRIDVATLELEAVTAEPEDAPPPPPRVAPPEPTQPLLPRPAPPDELLATLDLEPVSTEAPGAPSAAVASAPEPASDRMASLPDLAEDDSPAAPSSRGQAPNAGDGDGERDEDVSAPRARPKLLYLLGLGLGAFATVYVVMQRGAGPPAAPAARAKGSAVAPAPAAAPPAPASASASAAAAPVPPERPPSAVVGATVAAPEPPPAPLAPASASSPSSPASASASSASAPIPSATQAKPSAKPKKPVKYDPKGI